MKRPNLSNLKPIYLPIAIAMISGCVVETDNSDTSSLASETSTSIVSSSTSSTSSASSSSAQNSGEPYQWGLHAMQFPEA